MEARSLSDDLEEGRPARFSFLGEPRSLVLLAALTLLSGAAMLPAMAAMTDHGASVVAFESAGGVERSQEILAEWGDAGKTAAWWQLVIDTPFLVGYGLLLAGACLAVARRAERIGSIGLRRMATRVAWLGPIAAGADLIQNFALALILAGHETQPWPRVAAVCGGITLSLMAIGAVFVAVGVLRTRASASPGRR